MKLTPSLMRIGVDFGNTIQGKDANGVKMEFPRAMEVISLLVNKTEEVFIISKVNPQQMVDVTTWMCEHDFFRHTGIKMKNVRFCPGRGDKGQIGVELGLTHHIDDRPEVFWFMPDLIRKILFRPLAEDVIKWGQSHVKTVTSWDEIERMLLGD